MASSNVDLCHLVTENGVNSLLNTLVYGDRKFLVWTRLSLENRSWVLNASDGVDVWKVEMDKEHIDSYRVIAQTDTCEAFLTKIRSDFHLGHLMINPEASKVLLMVGAAESVIRIDLYEASTDDRKAELQHLILWMADNITTLTDRLKATTESLDRLKTQKETNPTVSTSFDLPPKQIQATPVKRKPGYSLVNPGSRNLPADLNAPTDGEEPTTHISVLSGSNMLDVFRCPDPSRCHFPCTKSNRRYHCPLCDNKPQKPGRMRRHFFTMHAGRHVVEHDGFRILRCKLKCVRANGRITDCSHYHCCLCGRVCLRKVHLCCHLQAHALGTAKDVDDDLMDVSKADEEQEEEEQEDDEDDETTEDTVLQTSQMACPVDDAEQNMVTLADGTQVVYVQSMENGETLTVVPVSSQSNTTQLSTAGQLNPSLHVLASSQANNGIQDLTGISHDGDGQDLETILRDEGSREIGSAGPAAPTNTSAMSTFHTYTSQISEPRQLGFDQSFNDLTNDQSNPNHGNIVVYEGNQDPTRLKTNNLTNVPCELNTQDPIELSGVNNSLNLNDLVSTTPGTAVPSMQSNPTMSTPLSSQALGTPLRNESLITGDSQLGQTPSNDQTPSNNKGGSDCIVLLKGDQENQGDDTVFNKLFSNTKPRVDSIFQHPSVIPEGTNLEVPRCKNTECDCRLYHCPLCTCLPNKPGRIREHFRKIHSENLIIRYQGYQMLRCKLGCCRSTGKRILNSHYHCCLCGCICISKSGVYEHMRTQHADVSLKKDTDSTQLNAEKRKSTATLTPPMQKKQAMDAGQPDPKPADEPSQRTPLVVQIPSVRNNQQRVSGIEQHGESQVNQPANDSNTSSNQPQQQQQQQPLVIVMPQQIQNTTQGQNQQPIVIVMPQGGSGGGVQMAQPYVVSMPQAANN